MVNPTPSRIGAGGDASSAAIAERGEALRRKEDDLFKYWKTGVPDLVRDGAMPGYAAADRRILFVLKEVSGDFKEESSDGVADLRQASSPLWSKGKGRWRRTWHAVIRWAAALNPALRFKGDITSEVWERVIGSIAVISIKKTPGGPTADHREIERFVRDPFNAGQLKAQLGLYEPDITICGSAFVADCLEPLCSWKGGAWRIIERGGSGDHIWERDSPMLGRVITFWHPGQRDRKGPELVDMLERIEADWVKDLASGLGATREPEVRSQMELLPGNSAPK